ncbi:forkhead box protein N1 [Colossoma macropomum]|uniref:forkhead box protein N1 n=1 Tax=Colossoma macropomum TaxID=42526 RepID=UPI0018653066|nr:forkhead box protein N1 [Colossoma macropomum]
MEEALRRVLGGNKEQHWGLMSTEPFPPAVSGSPTKSLQGALLVTSCPQMPLSQCPKPSIAEGSVSSSQRDSIPYMLKNGAAERFRRHSVDGSSLVQEHDSGKDKRFHPYSRQYSDGAAAGAGAAYCCLRECQLPDSLTPVLNSTMEEEEQNAWTPFSTTVQPSLFMGAEQSPADMQTMPEEPPSYSSSTHSTYSTLQQPFSGEYSSGGLVGNSHFSYQNFSSQTSQEGPVQPLYPKPIYSYSILIFMALRNSRTGSLPVSEIYSFMTEHFPYFKTAPDGWKNSVRHNLSLNKCFEKVENKNGSSSRKGCLWALNPAKVEKMQEELHKWRRKDPVTVRRSMARPEELDHLLGERPEKLKSLSTHLNNHTYPQFSRVSMPPSYSSRTPLRRPHYSHYGLPSQTLSQQHPYLPSNPQAFSFYPSITQQPSTRLPPRTGSLDSPLPAHTPPSYSSALQASHSAAGSMQELLMDGELSNDIDTLNPSLTDLQLQGHLWEELRNDSLAPDSLVVMDTSTSPGQISPNQAGDCVESCGSGSGEVSTTGSETRLQATGLYTSSFSSADSMAGLHSTSVNTPIPLL